MFNLKTTLAAATLTTALTGGMLAIGTAATTSAASAATDITAAAPVLNKPKKDWWKGGCGWPGNRCSFAWRTPGPDARFFHGHWRLAKKFCPGNKWKKHGFGPCGRGIPRGGGHFFHENKWLQ